jgi:prepilin-type N-terminal cleavage/methylation domain-containing protein
MRVQSGFTLLELSIVLVIVGLIAGGLTVGTELIDAAKVRSLGSQLDQSKTAINVFKLKYQQWPGDMNNASAYWPSCDPTPANCNGDRDNMIESGSNEDLRGWQELSLSGLVPESMTGVTGGATKFVLGQNTPATDFEGAGLWLRYYQFTSDNRAGNMLIVAGSETGTTLMEAPVISPHDASLVDAKVDDGIGLTGYMRGRNGVLGGSSTGGCITGPNYIVDNTSNVCRLYFLIE